MNETIVQLIKAARSERGISQKDLADHLGKTQETISNLERGKVQVSASELYQIAQLLNKPIEYFYGEEVGNKEIEDLIAVLRKQSSKDRIAALKMVSILVDLQAFTERLKKYPPDEKVPPEIAKEFYDLFAPFAATMMEWSQKTEEIQKMLGWGLKPSKPKKPRNSNKKR